MGSKPTPEFRQEVVRIALTSGLSRKQVASDFDIDFSTLGRWLKEGRNQVLRPEPQSDLMEENVVRNNNRVYLGTCAKSSELLPHQYRTVGWSMNDAQRYGQALQEVFINTSSGKQILQGSTLLAGTARVNYTLDSQTTIDEVTTVYSGCNKYHHQSVHQKMKRPDGTIYSYKTGQKTSNIGINVCSNPSDVWTMVLYDFAGLNVWQDLQYNTFRSYGPTSALVNFTDIRTYLREDGHEHKLFSTQTTKCPLDPALTIGIDATRYNIPTFRAEILSLIKSRMTDSMKDECIYISLPTLTLNAGW